MSPSVNGTRIRGSGVGGGRGQRSELGHLLVRVGLAVLRLHRLLLGLQGGQLAAGRAQLLLQTLHHAHVPGNTRRGQPRYARLGYARLRLSTVLCTELG